MQELEHDQVVPAVSGVVVPVVPGVVVPAVPGVVVPGVVENVSDKVPDVVILDICLDYFSCRNPMWDKLVPHVGIKSAEIVQKIYASVHYKVCN